MFIDSEALGIFHDGVHSDRRCELRRHDVAGVLYSKAKSDRTFVFPGVIFWRPHLVAKLELHRFIADDCRGGISVVQGGSINDRLEDGSRLSKSLGCAIELRLAVGEPAHHRHHAPRIRTHRDKCALNLGELAKAIVGRGFLFDEYDITRLQKFFGSLAAQSPFHPRKADMCRTFCPVDQGQLRAVRPDGFDLRSYPARNAKCTPVFFKDCRPACRSIDMIERPAIPMLFVICQQCRSQGMLRLSLNDRVERRSDRVTALVETLFAELADHGLPDVVDEITGLLEPGGCRLA